MAGVGGKRTLAIFNADAAAEGRGRGLLDLAAGDGNDDTRMACPSGIDLGVPSAARDDDLRGPS